MTIQFNNRTQLALKLEIEMLARNEGVREFAKTSGIDKGTLHRLLTGDQRTLRIGTLNRLATRMGWQTAELADLGRTPEYPAFLANTQSPNSADLEPGVLGQSEIKALSDKVPGIIREEYRAELLAYNLDARARLAASGPSAKGIEQAIAAVEGLIRSGIDIAERRQGYLLLARLYEELVRRSDGVTHDAVEVQAESLACRMKARILGDAQMTRFYEELVKRSDGVTHDAVEVQAESLAYRITEQILGDAPMEEMMRKAA